MFLKFKIVLGSNGSIPEQATVVTGAGHELVEVEDFDSDDSADVLVDFGSGNGVGNGIGLHNVLNVHGCRPCHPHPSGK